MLKENVTLDHNWVSVTVLAGEKEVAPSTVSSWITRGKIDYVVLQGQVHRRHLVDRRTAPVVQKKGRPRKPRLKQQPLHS